MEEQLTMAVTKTYSLTLAHVNMLKDLADRRQLTQAEVLREAIEDIYRKYPPNGSEPVVADEAVDGG